MTNHAHPPTCADAVPDLGADTAPLRWATTRSMPSVAVPAAAPATPASHARRAPDTAPALNPPVWSGRKTAIAAALAIGISSVGAVAAAAALPIGSTQERSGQLQPGRFPGRGQGGVVRQGPPGIATTDPRVATP